MEDRWVMSVLKAHALSQSGWASVKIALLLETAFFQTCRFPSEFSQIVDLCTPDSASGHHLDFVYDR